MRLRALDKLEMQSRLVSGRLSNFVWRFRWCLVSFEFRFSIFARAAVLVEVSGAVPGAGGPRSWSLRRQGNAGGAASLGDSRLFQKRQNQSIERNAFC